MGLILGKAEMSRGRQASKNGAGHKQELEEGSLAGQMEIGTGDSRLPGKVGPGLVDAVNCLPIALGEGRIELDVSRDPLQVEPQKFVKFSPCVASEAQFLCASLAHRHVHRRLAVCGWKS